jgi:hypothetical protein
LKTTEKAPWRPQNPQIGGENEWFFMRLRRLFQRGRPKGFGLNKGNPMLRNFCAAAVLFSPAIDPVSAAQIWENFSSAAQAR